MNGRTNSHGSSIDELQVPLDPCTSLRAEAGNGEVTLYWDDPVDKYATPEGETAQDPQQLVSVWDHTIVVRKVGSQPANPNDGIVVTSSGVRDQYLSTGYTDTSLTNDTTYYYGVFAVNEDGVASDGAFVNATPILGTPLSELAEGTLIKILENGAPVEFYLAKHNYEPDLNGQGRDLVVRKNIHSNGLYGQDMWQRESFDESDLYTWCNQTYYNSFSTNIKQLIGSTKFYTGQSTSSGSTGARNVQQEGHVFILSFAEYGFNDNSFGTYDGSDLPIAIALRIASLNGSPSSHWTRSWQRTSGTGANIWSISGEGTSYSPGQNRSNGRRPCFTLPSTATVDEELILMDS